MVGETGRPPLGQPGPSWHGDGALGGHPSVTPGTASAGQFDGTDLVPAPYLMRVLGFVVDQFVLAVTVGILLVPALAAVGVVSIPEPPPDGTALTFSELLTPSFVLTNMLTSFSYRWLWNTLGWSPGKRLLGLRTVDADGHAPGLRRGFIRTIWSILSEFPFWLGYAFAAWDSERRTWHDRLAGTWVVRSRPEDVPLH